MSDPAPRRDLLVLVADLDAELTMGALLARHRALDIRPVSFDIRRHLGRDSGCREKCHEFLRPFVRRYAYAIVIFDLHGSGREMLSAPKLETRIECTLAHSGWDGRSAAIVLDPELEAWVWSDSPQVDTTLGWSGRLPSLREWLVSSGRIEPPAPKPNDPKEAMIAALAAVRKPQSQALFTQLAERVSVSRCTDRAFVKLRSVLSGWFPPL